MRYSSLLAKSSCQDHQLKYWIKNQLIIPVQKGCGSGSRAVFDDANLVAVSAAIKMTKMHIKVISYVEAFKKLHELLRSGSSISWGQQVFFMTPNAVHFDKNAPTLSDIESGALVFRLFELVNDFNYQDTQPQLTLPFKLTGM